MKAKEKGPCRVQGCSKKEKYIHLCGGHYDRANRLLHNKMWVESNSPKQLLDALRPLSGRPPRQARQAGKGKQKWREPENLFLNDSQVASRGVIDAILHPAEEHVIEGFREPPKPVVSGFYESPDLALRESLTQRDKLQAILETTQNANNELREEVRKSDMALSEKRETLVKLIGDLNANDEARTLLEHRVEGMKLEASRVRLEHERALSCVQDLETRIQELEQVIPRLKQDFVSRQEADSDKIKELRQRLDEADAKLEEHEMERLTRPPSELRVLRVMLNTRGEPRILIGGDAVPRMARLIGKSVYITE